MADGNQSTISKVLLVVAALLGVFLIFRAVTGNTDPYSRDRLSQDIKIRCEETGTEWTLNRGWMERQLRTRAMAPGSLIDPSVGLANPETGTPTGFPVNREGDWEQTIERINNEKIAVRERGHR